MNTSATRRLFSLFGCATIVAAALSGCNRPPAVEFENLPLIASLRTACSARSESWLSGVVRAVERRHADGQMSPAEKAHFDMLIALARAGDWEAAERQCYQFERAQLNRRRSRPAAEVRLPHGGHAQPSAVARR